MTHLLSPLDITVNKTLKKFEKDSSVSYYSNQLAAQRKDVADVEDIRVDTRMSILKPIHAQSIADAYAFMKTEAGKKNIVSGWKSAGITAAVENARNYAGIDCILDPFANMAI